MNIEQILNSNVVYLAIFTWFMFAVCLFWTLMSICSFFATLTVWHSKGCAVEFKWGKMTFALTCLWSFFVCLKFFLNICLTV